jgi:tetratricopeptide (TPR) repeat protein
MKWKIGLVIVLLGAAVGLYEYKQSRIQTRCNEWFEVSKSYEERGYYSLAIEQLTLFFAQDKCRGRNDPHAVELLVKSRVHVPLPGNAHLAQQVSLSQYGWHLKRNDEHHVRMASANLVSGNWLAAHRSAQKARGAQAALIELVSSVFIANHEYTEIAVTRLAKAGPSQLQAAMARILLSRNPEIESLAERIEKPEAPYARLAIKLLEPDVVEYSIIDAGAIRAKLSDNDLAIASTLLKNAGSLELASVLLDQPQRPLSKALLLRLVDLLWLQNLKQVLGPQFLRRKATETMPAEAYLAICLVSRRQDTACQYRFPEVEYESRYGPHASRNWALVLKELSKDQPQPHIILTAMETMEDLNKGSGLVHMLASSMYTSIEETDLAIKALRRANWLGHSRPITQLTYQKLAPNCVERDVVCLEKALLNDPSNHALWHTALASGITAKPALALQLRDASPVRATLWRTVHANLALKEGTDKATAKALKLIRPVLQDTPTQSVPHLIAASATARFKDLDAAYLHLANAVKANPDKAVAALRLTIGFYETDRSIDVAGLVQWWQKITRLEMIARGQTVQGEKTKNLVAERLAILATYAEEKGFIKLAETTYRSMLELSPENHMALNNLAYKLYEQNKSLEDALMMAETAMSLAPTILEYGKTLRVIQAQLEKEGA